MGAPLPYPLWSLLVQSVAAAQVESCRLRAQFENVLRRVDGEDEEAREHAYKFYGDFLVGMPDRLRALEGTIQRAAFVLATTGPDALRRTMSVGDLAMVDEALGAPRTASAPPAVSVLGGARGGTAGILILLRGRVGRHAVAGVLRSRFGSSPPPYCQLVPLGRTLLAARCWGPCARG